MGLLLAIILLLLFLGSFVSIFVGLIAPKLFKPLFKRNLGRGKTSLIFFVIFIVSFVAFGKFGEKLIGNTSSNSSATQSVKSSSTPTPAPKATLPPKTTSSPTPTPADWIANPLCDNYSQYGSLDACLSEKYPLEATVKIDGLAIYITNTQNIIWTDCNANIDSNSYALNLFDNFSVEPKSITRLPWGRFIDENGNRFNYYKTQPGTIDITCTVNHEMRHASYSGF